MAGEFSLIDRYFGQRLAQPSAEKTASGASISISIGDDCAAFTVAPDCEVLTSVDTLVEGVHFFPDVAPEHLGHKALAVNLSDLAACGAEPIGFLLALTLPKQWSAERYGVSREEFLERFSQGLKNLSQRFACPLIGGDTTSTLGAGPLVITITVFGQTPLGQMLKRQGAHVGDDIWLSGPIGGAALALYCLSEPDATVFSEVHLPLLRRQQTLQKFCPCLERPGPHVALGMVLRGVATSCIDVSDGLAGDLGHVLALNKVAAVLEESCIPVPDELMVGEALFSTDIRRQLILQGGDDYELCFTAHPKAREAISSIAQSLGLNLQRIGRIVTIDSSYVTSLLHLQTTTGQTIEIASHAYEHFE